MLKRIKRFFTKTNKRKVATTLAAALIIGGGSGALVAELIPPTVITKPTPVVKGTAPIVGAQICNAPLLDLGPSSIPTVGGVFDPNRYPVTAVTSNMSNIETGSQLPASHLYWFAAGTYDNPAGDQVQPGNNDVFIGAPGAIIDGQLNSLNHIWMVSQGYPGSPNPATKNVTVEYLTVKRFEPPPGNGVINGNAGPGWIFKYDTVEQNAPGAGILLGSGNVVEYNCLTDNGEYGFNVYLPANTTGEPVAFTGGPQNITLSYNEISYNDTCDFEAYYPFPFGITPPAPCGWSGSTPDSSLEYGGCGCSGGGKFWETDNATVVGNWVHDNENTGIWADTDNAGFNFQNNNFQNNWGIALWYEISYNAQIVDNEFNNKAVGLGPVNSQGFPSGAIYISESGSDSRINTPYSTQFLISGNTFNDDWTGIIVWENSNRFCGSTTPSDSCTLVAPDTYNIDTCDQQNLANNTPASSPDYYDNCRWKSQNILAENNTFNYNTTDITAEMGCNSANVCSPLPIATVTSSASTVANSDNGTALSALDGTLDVASSTPFSPTGQVVVATSGGPAVLSYTGVGTDTLTGVTIVSGTSSWTLSTGNVVTQAYSITPASNCGSSTGCGYNGIFSESCLNTPALTITGVSGVPATTGAQTITTTASGGFGSVSPGTYSALIYDGSSTGTGGGIPLSVGGQWEYITAVSSGAHTTATLSNTADTDTNVTPSYLTKTLTNDTVYIAPNNGIGWSPYCSNNKVGSSGAQGTNTIATAISAPQNAPSSDNGQNNLFCGNTYDYNDTAHANYMIFLQGQTATYKVWQNTWGQDPLGGCPQSGTLYLTVPTTSNFYCSGGNGGDTNCPTSAPSPADPIDPLGCTGDADAGTDSTVGIFNWLNHEYALYPGQKDRPVVVEFLSTGCYQVNGTVWLRAFKRWTIEGNGATFQQNICQGGSPQNCGHPIVEWGPDAYPYSTTLTLTSGSDTVTASAAWPSSVVAGMGVQDNHDEVPAGPGGATVVSVSSSPPYNLVLSQNVTVAPQYGGGTCSVDTGSSTITGGTVALNALAGTLNIASSSSFTGTGDVTVAASGGTAVLSYTGTGSGTLTGVSIVSGVGTWTVTTGNAVNQACVDTTDTLQFFSSLANERGGPNDGAGITNSHGGTGTTGIVSNSLATAPAYCGNTGEYTDPTSGLDTAAAEGIDITWWFEGGCFDSVYGFTINGPNGPGCTTAGSCNSVGGPSPNSTLQEDTSITFAGCQQCLASNNSVTGPYGDYGDANGLHEAPCGTGDCAPGVSDIFQENTGIDAGRDGFAIGSANQVLFTNNTINSAAADNFDIEVDNDLTSCDLPEGCGTQNDETISDNTIVGDNYQYNISAITTSQINRLAITGNQYIDGAVFDVDLEEPAAPLDYCNSNGEATTPPGTGSYPCIFNQGNDITITNNVSTTPTLSCWAGGSQLGIIYSKGIANSYISGNDIPVNQSTSTCTGGPHPAVGFWSDTTPVASQNNVWTSTNSTQVVASNLGNTRSACGDTDGSGNFLSAGPSPFVETACVPPYNGDDNLPVPTPTPAEYP